jgi:hypothetical protein
LGELRASFYIGAWVMLGFISKTHNMPDHAATKFLHEVQLEVKLVVESHVRRVKSSNNIIKGGGLQS